jgi:carboxyl-terminal processing protease
MVTTIATRPRIALGLGLAALLTGSAAAEPGVTVQPYRGTDRLRGLEAPPTVTESRRFDPGVGYLRIEAFSGRTPAEVGRALARLGSLEWLVIDLRGNGGGRLEAAREVAELFALLWVEIGDGRRQEVRSRGPGRHAGPPLAILVDGGTASAAEVLAGALHRAGAARLVGARTAGKATIHTAAPEEDGRVRWVATGEVVLADGTSISGRGLEPETAADSGLVRILGGGPTR